MRTILLLLLVIGTMVALPPASSVSIGVAWAAGEVPDTLEFVPSQSDSAALFIESEPERSEESGQWVRGPLGDGLLTNREIWRAQGDRRGKLDLRGEYNRVDRLRLGLGYQLQVPEPMAPRLGARIEYAFGRDRALYGVQLEQPVIPPGRIAIGASLIRRTDHSDLQQVPDVENTLALLFGRQDYRDYFEREGLGLYLAWRVPDFSTVSVHLRRDEYRSLPLSGAQSWFHQSRLLRDNPAIDEGETHTAVLRLERSALATAHAHAGLYHRVEAEWAGHGLGGDFDYTRILGDVRSVVRLTPATTLMLRLVAGATPSGVLPAQKRFPLGGVDGLRAHEFSEYLGNQLALAQAEYTIGLWRLRTGAFEGGLHAIAFVDAGRAWFDSRHRWSLGDQRMAVDGGFGLAAAEDNLRVYFAKDLQHTDSDFVISMRLHRPF